MEYTKTVVDGHYHIYEWENNAGEDFFRTTDAYCAARNFRAINIAALPAYKRDAGNNIMIALYKLHNPDVYIHGGLCYPAYPVPETLPEGMDLLTQYRELMEIGFDGIKMIETKPDRAKVFQRPVCGDLYRDFFAAVEADGTHILWHVNDPAEFWDKDLAPDWSFANGWFYGDGTFPSHEELYRQTLAVLERNPNLKSTFAHFFFMSGCPERLESIFEKYPNVAVDLTPGSEMYGNFKLRAPYYRDFFTRHADRILFGTDSSDEDSMDSNVMRADVVYNFLSTPDDFHIWEVASVGLDLEPAVQEKILGGNFLRRVGDTPKPVNVEALKRYIEKYRSMIRDPELRAKIDAELMRL